MKFKGGFKLIYKSFAAHVGQNNIFFKVGFYSMVLLPAIFIIASCTVLPKKRIVNQVYYIPTVKNNVCKTLKGDVVLYAIFVDTKFHQPWTKHEINSTLDSVNHAMNWIMTEAEKRGVELNIIVKYHSKSKVVPITNNLPKQTIGATAGLTFVSHKGYEPGGIKNLDKWADKVASLAIKSLPPDTSSITKNKVKAKGRAELITRLRDIYQTDNIALMFFVNSYYTDDFSLALHIGEDFNVEYAVVHYKFPLIIAHEFLHLFGALDLYVTPFDSKKKNIKIKQLLEEEFPNEVMTFTQKPLEQLSIDEFTEYLIGWRKSLRQELIEKYIGKNIKLAEY